MTCRHWPPLALRLAFTAATIAAAAAMGCSAAPRAAATSAGERGSEPAGEPAVAPPQQDREQAAQRDARAALDDPLQPVAPAFEGRRPTMAQASAHFAAGGAQPGQRLPALSLLDLQGQRVDVAALQRGRPLVLTTCSLTCNVARRQQPALTGLQQQHGDAVAFVMVYTIDAHPHGDPCPYSGAEWVPPANADDRVLVRQPATLAARLELARRYARDWSPQTTVLVDTMDNASWRALGEAPNAAVVVGGDGVVVERCGWLDPQQVERALQGLPASR